MKGMSLTRTRLRVAVRVMRYYNSVPLTGAMPVMVPVRGRANHQFTGGYDYRLKRRSFFWVEMGIHRLCPRTDFTFRPERFALEKSFLTLGNNLVILKDRNHVRKG